ncbi:MAG: protein translocase subunit SecD [Myxacorys chilensis ATA2-1-KO14]|jgi:preprotein translocase subunit SecD|nr:protein translocase subunit SecD [Myxacorys chilensis ATA2-1-KO14]
MGRQRGLLLLILALVIASIVVIVKVPTRLGLDLRGGSQLTIQVKPTEEIKKITERELEAVQKVIEGRINGLGVSEPVIQTAGEDQVLVQLPGVDNPQQAERVLGGTAQLDFRSENPTQIAFLRVRQEELQELQTKQPALEKAGDQAAIAANQAAIVAKEKQVEDAVKQVYEKTGLDGRYLKDARTELQGNVWAVGISFDQKGADLFAALTKKAAQTNTRLGIFLDDKLLSSPSVDPAQFAQTGITGGNAVITGNFTAESARELELQLRGGSLPVPIQIVENRTVGATLGQDSIRSSIIAGIGGLTLVLVFMVVYYRLPGVIAAIALVIYALLTFAAFNLLGVTLTLPGIAGFILSIGMAVDANVLIFERTREEIKAGKTLYRSVESGFFRAFSSILDSNVTTLIACAALFWLGAGLVRGFALTLALGVVISMFTAITCSRTLMLYVLSIQSLRKPELFCPNIPNKPSAEATS